MQIENLTSPGQPLADGDQICINHGNGIREIKHYWLPVDPPAPSRRDVIRIRLAEIDRDSTKPRTMRELQLNKAETKEWLQQLDDEAAALREELKTIAAEKAAKRAAELGGGGGPVEPP